jgi:voltage-gated potassium channel
MKAIQWKAIAFVMDCSRLTLQRSPFIIITSFVPRNFLVSALDIIFGLAILANFLARLAISSDRIREFFRPVTYADIAAIVSFLAPVSGEAVGFLRVLRTLRLLYTFQVLARLRADSEFFRRNEDIIIAATNLVVFIFIITANV